MEQLTTPYDLYVDLTEGTILVYVNGVPGTKIIQFYQNEGKTSVLNIHIRQQNDVLKLQNKTVRIAFKKPDDEIVWQPCEIVDANIGKVTVALEEQTLVVPGDLAVQLQVSDANGRISESDVFYIRVHKSLMTGETIKSTSSLPLLENAIKAGELFKGYKVSDLAAIKPTAEAAKKAVDDTNKRVDANSGRLTVLEKDMSKQDIKAQSLTHGPNLVNATVASPLNVEVQGRTLVNLLGQTTLDPTKYYLFMPNKGTTKITAGGSSYDGVAKFTGQSAITYTIKQDYRRKVAGSTVENGHIAKRTWSHSTLTTLAKPTETSSSIGEVEQLRYADYISLDGKYSPTSVNFNGGIAQEMHSFDVIRALQDKFGIQIWQGKTALADKVMIAKQLIADYTVALYARGSGPKGNKVYVKRWIPSTSTWFGSTISTENNPTKIQTGSASVQEIDNNGFIHVIAYADASDGARPSLVSVDLAAFELKTKIDSSMVMLEDALYEVNQAIYNKINVDPEYSGSKLIDKFPYVEGIQHLNPVVITEGANLTPGLSEWTHSANAQVVGSDVLEILSTGIYQQSSVSIEAFPSTTYTYTVEKVEGTGAFIGINFIDINGNFISQINADNNTPSLTVTTPPNCRGLQLKLTGREHGNNTLVFSKPMCVIGDKPKPFVPRNPSYLHTNTVLAGMSGINDVLYKEDGQWKVLRKWGRDLNLYGDIFEWKPNGNRTGGKEFIITFSSKEGAGILSRYDGVSVSYSKLPINNGDGFNNTGSMALRITVPNKDTGFLESYTPIGDETKAYFNGWKVKNADANGKPTAWVSLVDGQDAPTQTLAYVKANRAQNYTPYRLTYQFATPRVENVQIEGELVVDGLTQINIDTGVVVREKVKPKAIGDEYYINVFQAGHEEQRLKNRCNYIINVYKNGSPDAAWILSRYGTEGQTGYGNARVQKTLFDPKAEYTVTYLVLDKHQFTTNATDVRVSYNQSIRSTTDALTVGQSNNTTSISILQNLMMDVLARLKANSL
ncbi:BppU family phage baseplate upper protein [Bacillus sp. NPDC094077]|uniref:BppU family phage baseplate upper protein n=1 Tax=Bacillus sp. NPDC094077 TaxID=3390932 RepID=UPI003D0527E0